MTTQDSSWTWPGITEMIGVDVSQSMIDEAAKRHEREAPRLHFMQGDGSELDFETSSFDVVRAKLVLMHCDNIEKTFAEILRILKPGGQIAIFDYDFDCLAVDHPDQEVTRRVLRRFSDGTRNNWSARQLFRRFTLAGLKDVTVEPITVRLPFDLFEPMVSGRGVRDDMSVSNPAASAEAAW
ncbi:hypothetical protein BHUM_01881 [Candidatus Burkholderia humilis]|nr:hypothetical protein BHUM_01881 [Candidatus Burkholderia humilis]